MSKSRILHALAMEELEDDNLEGGVAVVEEPEGIVEGAEEVAEAEAEIQENADVVEELEEAGEALESIYYALENHRDEGLSPQAAMFAKIAVDNITARIGESVDMPSHESFEGNSRAVQSTELSLEGIGDTLKRIWEKIKSWISKVWQAIKNFFKRWFTQAGRVKAKAEALKKQATKAASGGSTKSLGDVEIPAALAAKFLVDKTNSFTIDDCIKGTNNLVAALNDSLSFEKITENAAKSTFGALEKLAIALKDEENGDDKAKDIVDSMRITDFARLGCFKNEIQKGNVKAYATDWLPGGVRFYYGSRQQGKIANVVFSEFVNGKETRPVKPKEAVKIAAMPIKKVRVAIDGSIELIELANKTRANVEKIIDGANSLMKKNLSWEIRASAYIPNTIMNTVRRYLASLGKGNGNIVSHTLSYSSSLLSLQKLLLSKHKL